MPKALQQRARQFPDDLTSVMDALRQLRDDVNAEAQPHNKQAVVDLLTSSIEQIGLARTTLWQAAEMIEMPPPVLP